MCKKIILSRFGGLGDVCMAMCAAQAIAGVRWEVHLQTAPEYFALAHACPAIKSVFTDIPLELKDALLVNLGAAIHGLRGEHEVDSFLEEIPGEVPSHCAKKLLIDIEGDLTYRPTPFDVILHASVGDPNRTWHPKKWQELGDRLQEDGLTVACTGKDPDKTGKGAYRLDKMPCYFDLSHLETISLLRQCRAFVSCDSGPIQLAGATDCAIVGIYSAVAAKNRMPFRHYPARNIAVPCYCPHAPCYEKACVDEVWKEHAAPKLQAGQHLGKALADWCLAGEYEETFGCMSSLSVQTVHAAIVAALA